ncbi:DUF4089 domain-containing protein [Vineibacter terrae]|uniref:DUF4089 domain-containing protein n=1 Tax=Vineibacter terrae TaxID=2586908 RepID=UPI002E34F2B4|nr:DUF4089 domain-containing protein [Vineibacter terrae]HEX2891995.1 DUF4089 domain-containing protein [Vineibacter terrae]
MSDPKEKEPDVGAYVDAMAEMVGLPIAPQYRDAVIANMARTAQVAALALAEPLADDLEAAPVFRP